MKCQSFLYKTQDESSKNESHRTTEENERVLSLIIACFLGHVRD